MPCSGPAHACTGRVLQRHRTAVSAYMHLSTPTHLREDSDQSLRGLSGQQVHQTQLAVPRTLLQNLESLYAVRRRVHPCYCSALRLLAGAHMAVVQAGRHALLLKTLARLLVRHARAQ